MNTELTKEAKELLEKELWKKDMENKIELLIQRSDQRFLAERTLRTQELKAERQLRIEELKNQSDARIAHEKLIEERIQAQKELTDKEIESFKKSIRPGTWFVGAIAVVMVGAAVRWLYFLFLKH